MPTPTIETVDKLLVLGSKDEVDYRFGTGGLRHRPHIEGHALADARLRSDNVTQQPQSSWQIDVTEGVWLQPFGRTDMHLAERVQNAGLRQFEIMHFLREARATDRHGGERSQRTRATSAAYQSDRTFFSEPQHSRHQEMRQLRIRSRRRLPR
jgi:hypothetical protein